MYDRNYKLVEYYPNSQNHGNSDFGLLYFGIVEGYTKQNQVYENPDY